MTHCHCKTRGVPNFTGCPVHDPSPLNREAQASVALDGETQCVATFEELVQVLKDIETLACVTLQAKKPKLYHGTIRVIAAKAHNAVRGL